MKIHLYTICWNEEEMLPYFLRHYEKFVDKIVVYDNGSTDKSAEIVAAHPLCELRDRSSPTRNEDDLLWVKSESWKQDVKNSPQVDWLICCDVDEFLFHAKPRQYLESCLEKGVSLPRIRGFEMVSESFPNKKCDLTRVCQRGFPRRLFSKRIVFSPTHILSMNYTAGCHYINPQGNVVEDNPGELMLLHYGSIGRDRIRLRRLANSKRNSLENRQRGFGRHNDLPDSEFHCAFDEYIAYAEPCMFLGARSVTFRDVLRWGRRWGSRMLGYDAKRPSL